MYKQGNPDSDMDNGIETPKKTYKEVVTGKRD